jgi:hypothetical protein
MVLIAGLAGCRHKTPAILPQVSKAPIELETPPESANAPMIEPLPDAATVTPPPVPTATPPKRARRRPTPPPKEPPPTQVASAEPAPGVTAIGELSSGTAPTPETQQAVKDLIAAIEKRITALPSATANQQRGQIRQVRLFLKQSQQALNSGDAEAAKNLATKAKLLMDDVEKK